MHWSTRMFALGLLLVAQGAIALELFGVQLESTSRDAMREAAKVAGLELIREGGEDNWFDIYDSSGVLEDSKRLYLGFVKRDQRFAFAEYEFHGLKPKRLLRELTRKYGAAEIRNGRFFSDRSYHWQRDGIEINLDSDWHNYKFRLSYVIPANLEALQAERAAGKAEDSGAARVSLY